MAGPFVGDECYMDFIGSDGARIIVSEIPLVQHYLEREIYSVIDQYGETHYVEDDGSDGWLVINEP